MVASTARHGVVARVTDAAGATLYEPAPEPRRAIAPETAAAMKTILASVFDKGKDGGTAKDHRRSRVRAGGGKHRHGSSKYDPVTKKYADDRYLSSFAGLAPIDAPRIAVVVMVDDPSGGDYYGGKVAGPVFAVVASQVLRYLGVPSEAPQPVVASLRPQVAGPKPEAGSPKPQAGKPETDAAGSPKP